MDHVDLLTDAAQRPVESAAQVLDAISGATLHARPGDRGSSIAWLVWHAARQMDAQLSDLTGEPQVWVSGAWSPRLGVERGPEQMGFGDTAEQVAGLRITDPTDLLAYLRDVVSALVRYARTLSSGDLDEVIDTSWDPPVTRGVRLVSLIDDAVAHVAQAAYARGLVEGWSIGY